MGLIEVDLTEGFGSPMRIRPRVLVTAAHIAAQLYRESGQSGNWGVRERCRLDAREAELEAMRRARVPAYRAEHHVDVLAQLFCAERQMSLPAERAACEVIPLR